MVVVVIAARLSLFAAYGFTTLAGSTGAVVTSQDGTGAAAQFDAPRGVAIARAGTIYVADTTLAGAGRVRGSTDATGASARFEQPFGIAVDSGGTVYLADAQGNTIRKITAARVVTTLAGRTGSAGSAGSTDGRGTAARFKYPSGIAVDRSGTVFVADTDNQSIQSITSDGEVTTIAVGAVGSTDGVGTAARFLHPKGLSVSGDGRLYVADLGNRTIRLGSSQ